MSKVSAHTHLTDLTEERIGKLFRELDVNRDGNIDFKDLNAALRRLRVPQLPEHAKKFLHRYDWDKSGDINYDEFFKFVRQRERDLKISFEHFDKNKDGTISIDEIKSTFHDLGVEITNEHVSDLLEKLDKERSLCITWNEWREFFLLHPNANGKIYDIVHYWSHSMIDVGEAGVIPDPDASERMQHFSLNLVAGAVAGAVSRTATAPLDRLRIFLQVYGGHYGVGIISGSVKLVREGGFFGMFRGNCVNVLKIAPETAVKFACFEKLKKLITHNSNRKIGPIERFAAGSTAGVLAQTSIYPMEVIKTRLALGRTGEYRSMIDCAYQTFRRGGLRAFYRGYLPSIIGIIPYAGIDLAVYETLRSLYKTNNGREANVLVTLSCGVVSSTSGQLASFPLNVLRTNMQANANFGSSRPLTASEMLRKIWHKDGVRGLYRGLLPSMMKAAPAISITYVVYEQVRKYFRIN